jgi:type I restriction enzyme S subunit
MKFRETTLGEISGGGSYGLGASSNTDSTGPKFLRTTDIVSGTIDWSHVPYCSADSVTIAKYKLFHEDIVISRTGANAGLNCLVLAPPKNAIFAGYLVRFQINRELADARYVSYVLRSSLWKDYVEVTRTGSAQPQFNAVLMSQFPISLPTLNTQKAISTLLSALDAKIAVNNGLSKTLEDIAQAIFKSWFIDFDPVKAKMAEEKPAGMDVATAALFPNSMEESEFGLVPKGWEVLPSTDFFEVLSGGTPKTSNEDYWNGDIPWFSVVDAPDSGGCYFIKTNKTITEEGLNNSAAQLVRPGVTVISARGTVGKIAMVAIPSTFNQSCYGIEGKYGDFFTYFLLRNQVVRLQNISHGGMFDTITRETFSAIKLAKPRIELINIFESTVSPIVSEILNLQFQSNNLAIIRDSLLPRLISGDLQIPEEMLAS